jgi:hypothetical protein
MQASSERVTHAREADYRMCGDSYSLFGRWFLVSIGPQNLDDFSGSFVADQFELEADDGFAGFGNVAIRHNGEDSGIDVQLLSFEDASKMCGLVHTQRQFDDIGAQSLQRSLRAVSAGTAETAETGFCTTGLRVVQKVQNTFKVSAPRVVPASVSRTPGAETLHLYFLAIWPALFALCPNAIDDHSDGD